MNRSFKQRAGSSLVEVLIAVGVVAVVMVGIMSSGTIARLSVEHRDRGDAYAIGIRFLEWAETIPLSADIDAKFRDAFGDAPKFGPFTVSVTRDPDAIGDASGEVSADVTVTISDGKHETKLTREVSRGARQNAGELP